MSKRQETFFFGLAGFFLKIDGISRKNIIVNIKHSMDNLNSIIKPTEKRISKWDNETQEIKKVEEIGI